jgi:hypothetical protein
MSSIWGVVIEEQAGAGDPRGWSVAEAARHPDRESAENEAYLLAKQHRPVRPSSPQGRTVLRVAGGYLVLVRGKLDTWQFRVSLGEEIR